MNLKLNNDSRNAVRLQAKSVTSAVKEERRRTGRYIAILVGISLLLLAIYHAWVRRIPVVASLVVPALIMFIYVAWVLYTASRDKHKALDLEAAMQAMRTPETAEDISPTSQSSNIEIAIISDSSGNDDPELKYNSKTQMASHSKLEGNLAVEFTEHFRAKPIILVNDEPPDDLDRTPVDVPKAVINENRKLTAPNKIHANRRYFRNKKRNVFKRSYSIA